MLSVHKTLFVAVYLVVVRVVIGVLVWLGDDLSFVVWRIFMTQYCDSQALERNWFHWILSSSVPDLECFRKAGVLWTKVLGSATHNGQILTAHGKPLPDPSYPVRRHCLSYSTPLFCDTHNGEKPKLFVNVGTSLLDRPKRLVVPYAESVEYASAADHNIAAYLLTRGYRKEPTTAESWHLMLGDISKICAGISTKFKLRSEDEQQDLASDAFVQITNKLVSGRLVYMPGRAPVFNLLTTTTYRIIYSILNKKNNHRANMKKLIDDAAAGIIPSVGRSVRAPVASYLSRITPRRTVEQT